MTRHEAGGRSPFRWLAGVRARVAGWLTSRFTKRLAEECAVAFAASFWVVFRAGGDKLSTGVFGAAVAAGLRACYGVFVRDIGADSQSPTIK